jgi:hypothetical protein
MVGLLEREAPTGARITVDKDAQVELRTVALKARIGTLFGQIPDDMKKPTGLDRQNQKRLFSKLISGTGILIMESSTDNGFRVEWDEQKVENAPDGEQKPRSVWQVEKLVVGGWDGISFKTVRSDQLTISDEEEKNAERETGSPEACRKAEVLITRIDNLLKGAGIIPQPEDFPDTN